MTAAKNVREALDWLPIDSAPKDGTRVRLINMDTGVEDAGYWCDESHVPQETRDVLWPEWFRNADGTWPDGQWSQDEGNGDMTHWKPEAAQESP